MNASKPSPRSAIVTGAASGLGRAIAVRLARDGWHLALADTHDAGSTETLALVESAGGSGQVEHLDVSQPDAWAALVTRLEAAWPQLDLLVNNAGVAGSGEVGHFALDDWRWLLATNLYGVIYGSHTCIPWLKRNPRGGHIINTASLAGILSAPTMAAYNVSKAGILSLSETLSGELAKDNVGVTVLCPSFFQTNLLIGGRFDTEELRQVAARSMERAKFTADDVAEAAVRAMYKKRLYVVMPRKGRRWWRLKRAVPGLFYYFLGERYRQGLPESL